MNKILGITAILMTAMFASGVLADPIATATVYCTLPSDCTTTLLTLENKNTTTWTIINDGISATLTFGTIGPQFTGTLTTNGLTPGTNNYALIYKPDTANRFVNWNGAGGVVITTFNGNGVFPINTPLVNLPIPADWNVNPVPNYCNNANGFDSYAHCAGAKLWIVLTSDLTGGNSLPLINWNPTKWLFETDLVTYTVGNPTTTCVGGQCVPIVCGMTATGNPGFGSIIPGATVQSGITTTVTNTGNVQVNPLISGANWVGSTYPGNGNAWMPVGATQWTVTNWASVVPLTTTPTSIGALSPLGTATVWYQLTVPSPQPTDTYTQTITFTASC